MLRVVYRAGQELLCRRINEDSKFWDGRLRFSGLTLTVDYALVFLTRKAALFKHLHLRGLLLQLVESLHLLRLDRFCVLVLLHVEAVVVFKFIHRRRLIRLTLLTRCRYCGDQCSFDDIAQRALSLSLLPTADSNLVFRRDEQGHGVLSLVPKYRLRERWGLESFDRRSRFKSANLL